MGAAPRVCPPSPVSVHARRACAPAQGVPPLPSLVLGSPPPPLLQAVRWTLSLHGRCLHFHLWFRSSLSLSLLHVVRGVCTLLIRGVPPFLLSLAARWGSALPGWGVPLFPPRAHMLHALRFRGVPLLLLSLAARWGSARPSWGSPLLPFPRAVCARCWVGFPPNSSFLWSRAWFVHCHVRGSPSGPWLRAIGGAAR